MRIIKEKNGITLITLAVTITFVLGEDGIINKAKEVAKNGIQSIRLTNMLMEQ